MANVSISRCEDYSESEFSVHEALSYLGGMKAFVKKGERILIKANLLTGKSSEHVISPHPEIVRAVIKEVQSCGGKPTVGDSPALQSAEKAATACGIKQVCDELRVPLINLDSPEELEIPKGKILKRIKISGLLKKFDKIINLPKLKTHSLTAFTGAVKNMFGCVPGLAKGSMHLRFQTPEQFSQMILDLHSALKPDLNIMDGVMAMEGAGPNAGTPRKVGVVIASESALALDAVACNIVGINAPLLKIAKSQGLKDADIKSIQISGATVSKVKNFKKASISGFGDSWIGRSIRNHLVARPVVDPIKCIGCKDCYNVCPTKTIEMQGKKAFIIDKNCIKCYCCHEVCPHKAIFLKKGPLSKLVGRLLK